MKPYKQEWTIGSMSTGAGMGVVCGIEVLEELLIKARDGNLDITALMRRLDAPFDISEAISERSSRVAQRMDNDESFEEAQANEPQPPVVAGEQVEDIVVFRTGDGDFPVRAITMHNSRYGPFFGIRVDILENLDEEPTD